MKPITKNLLTIFGILIAIEVSMIATMPLIVTTHSTNKGLFDALFETSDWLVQPIIALALFIALSAMVGAKEGMSFKIRLAT